ncbi:hypothetical protein EDB86DRAFT_2831423 [Lactarius hatsudake]|nr:hypothetical protein EDB86DRAFT_2831423 [Lactarius hatsudake]
MATSCQWWVLDRLLRYPTGIDSSKDELGEDAPRLVTRTLERPLELNSGGSATVDSPDGLSPSEAHSGRKDFDDGANALWNLYGEEAQIHDEARFESLAADMSGVPTFAGLFATVLTSFLVQGIQNLQANPAQESAYYQKQSVVILAQISQQISSIAPQVSIPPPPLHYSAIPPSSSDIRVNVCWLIGLVCSLSAALFAILVQQWVRSYMQVFQRYNHPLKRGRFRQFYFEGAKRIQLMAGTVPMLMHCSLFLFFGGLVDSMLSLSTTVGVTTIVPACFCGMFYLGDVSTRLVDPRSPNYSPISRWLPFWVQNLRLSYLTSRTGHMSMSFKLEGYREQLVMGESEGRKGRDVRALQWLVNNTAVKADVEPLALAIPGSFDTEWGREVWREVSSHGGSHANMSDHSPAGGQVTLSPISQRSLEGSAVYTISRCVRYLFKTCNNHNHFKSDDARRRRMRACVEAAASLVCCIDFRLEWFGEVSELLSEIGHMEKVYEPLTSRSDQSFTVRWTCLSLMAVQQMLRSKRLQALARYAVSGLTRIQPDVGRADEAALKSARWIDERLKMAWEGARDLRQAFEPWGQEKTREQVEEILRNYELQISALKIKADGTEFDERVSFLQDKMDDISHRLMLQLPSVSFSEFKNSGPFPTDEISNVTPAGAAPVKPYFIFPRRQVQALSELNLQLHDIFEGRGTEKHIEALESLKSINMGHVPPRRSNGLMTRQLWRLQDLRDGGGLGFTIELFFLSLRQLLSASSSQESDSVFYAETFKKITSSWNESMKSLGTQNILLELICDLVIQGRGIFSDFSYPDYITTMFLRTAGNMLREYPGPDSHIDFAMREIESVDSGNCMGVYLRRMALDTLSQSRSNRNS